MLGVGSPIWQGSGRGSAPLPRIVREAGRMLITAVGSMPGLSARESATIVAGELDLPHVVEVPARGPGADLIGRSLALISHATGEFAGETTPAGWRLAGGRPGAARVMRRGLSWALEDLDAAEETLAGFTGTAKTQLAGPWTLACGVAGANGHRLLTDPGACAELAAGLAQTAGQAVGDLRRRLPAASSLWVQLDEPSLPAALAGRIPTPSGRGRVRIPEEAEVVSGLAQVAQAVRGAGAVPVVHCCAVPVPFEILRRAGIAGVSVDLTIQSVAADDEFGRWWEAGNVVVAGLAPALDVPALPAVAAPLAALWSRLGYTVEHVGERTHLSPACGLAGASPSWPRQAVKLLKQARRELTAGR